MVEHGPLLIDLSGCVILVSIVIEDARRFRIRNSFVLALVTLFFVNALFFGTYEALAWHGLFALAALAVMAGAFALNMVGAGDAKLIAAACLWIGPESSLPFTVALLVVSLMYCGGAKIGILPSRLDGNKLKIPFGPSIAIAWMSAIAINV